MGNYYNIRTRINYYGIRVAERLPRIIITRHRWFFFFTIFLYIFLPTIFIIIQCAREYSTTAAEARTTRYRRGKAFGRSAINTIESKTFFFLIYYYYLFMRTVLLFFHVPQDLNSFRFIGPCFFFIDINEYDDLERCELNETTSVWCLAHSSNYTFSFENRFDLRN